MSSSNSALTPNRVARSSVWVKFNDPQPDLKCRVNLETTVQELKDMIMSQRPTLADKRLRFIYTGQLLGNEAQLGHYPRLRNALVAQSVPGGEPGPPPASLTRRQEKMPEQPEGSDDADRDDNRSGSASNDETADRVMLRRRYSPARSALGAAVTPENTIEPVFIHCAVSDPPPPETTSEPAPPTTTRPARQPVGFDRLRDAGFSEQEIGNIRDQFHMFQGNQPNIDNEDQIRNMEEEWMDNGGQNAAVDGVSGQGYTELFQGFCIGFFLGLFAPFWYKENMTPRQHVGK
ncbi:hypothetical protein IWQ60_004946 [Tieghemiomyces parasiticus]|uniref:Ubiquitin-like domain-containing protein n=1 Tax=Tieghemiomyces parasiticus TaxID=78921 RepID=A0A9W8AA10_9FUNG|nr:hypothetical protein IWQ60_004946 [Tieghemiomyces parasiticus]